jgi:hypothetical protein
MNKLPLHFTLVIALLTCPLRDPLALHAQTVLEICGSPSEMESEQVKGNLEGKAQTLARIGQAELQGEAARIRSEITVGSNRSDAARELHYLNYLSCVAIFSDKSLSTDEKLARIRALRAGLYPSAAMLPPQFNTPTPTRPVAPPTAPEPPHTNPAPPTPQSRTIVPQPHLPPPEILPPVNATVTGPALELGGQHWVVTIDGQTLDISFGAAPDHRVTLSGGHYGSEGTWWATSSVGFQIITDSDVMEAWFQLRNAQIASCGGYVAPRGGGQRHQITACERRT